MSATTYKYAHMCKIISLKGEKLASMDLWESEEDLSKISPLWTELKPLELNKEP